MIQFILFKTIKLFIAIYLVLILNAKLFAQEIHHKHIKSDRKESLSLNIPFNSEDILIGASFFPPVLDRYNLSIMTSIYIRPFAKKELIRQSDTSYNLYREYRHYAELRLYKLFDIYKDYNLYTSLSVGIMAVFRRGSKSDFTEWIRPIANIGICTPKFRSISTNFQLRAGFQYLATPTYKSNYIYVSIVFPDIL
jgi:hypothetical protein